MCQEGKGMGRVNWRNWIDYPSRENASNIGNFKKFKSHTKRNGKNKQNSIFKNIFYMISVGVKQGGNEE